MILIGAALFAAVGLITGLAFWTLGIIFHLAALAFRVAVAVAVAAFVWRWITRQRSHRYDI